MSDDLRARLRASMAQTPRPTRAEGKRRVLIVHTIAVVVMLAIFQGAGGAAHGAGRPIHMTFLVVASVTAVAVVASYLSTPPRDSMLARPWWVRLALALLAPVVVTIAMTMWHAFYVEPYSRFGWRCMALTVGMGLVLSAAMFSARRNRELHSPALTGSALGVTAGVWATLLVDVWCPLTNLEHVLVGHAAPIAILAVLGLIGGIWLLPIKPR